MAACFVFATLTGTLWYFTVASICVSLMTSEVVHLLYSVPTAPRLLQNSVSLRSVAQTDGGVFEYRMFFLSLGSKSLIIRVLCQ